MLRITVTNETDQTTRTLSFTQGIVTIGKLESNQIILPLPTVSRQHARIFWRDGSWILIDCESTNGTYLKGRKLRSPARLREGSRFRIADCTFSVEEATPPVIEGTFQDGINRSVINSLKGEIHKRLLTLLDLRRLDLNQLTEEELRQKTEEGIRTIMGEMEIPAPLDRDLLIKELCDEALGLGPLEDLLSDPSVSEIMVNGSGQIFIERGGVLDRSEKSFSSNAALLSAIERIVAPIGRRIDESTPMVDARLKDGSRINAIIPPLSLSGPCLTIRKFPQHPFTIEDLIRFKTLSVQMARLLSLSVESRQNIIISGGTGSGKTTTLNVLASFIPPTERIITIEDSAELRLPQEHVVSLEARPANIEGKGTITIRDLVRNALRMRPDRIVVGECRGGEALDMLQAMNTGHDGSLTTIHANTPQDLTTRLETMVLMSGMDLPVMAIREQIASAINIIVQQTRFPCGSRKIIQISEVVGCEEGRVLLQDIFSFHQTGVDEKGKVQGAFLPTGYIPRFMEELVRKGLSVSMDIFHPSRRDEQ